MTDAINRCGGQLDANQTVTKLIMLSPTGDDRSSDERSLVLGNALYTIPSRHCVNQFSSRPPTKSRNFLASE